MTISIGLIGDYDAGVIAHQAIPKALEIVSREIGKPVEPYWLATSTIFDRLDTLDQFHGFWCVPASPYASTKGALAAIRFAREKRKPFLGTCGGFQHALLEYAQNFLGITGASHAETDPDAENLIVSRLSCSLVEKSGSVHFKPHSSLAQIHRSDNSEETYHCNYGLNPAYESRLFGKEQLEIAARDDAGDVRALQLAPHPFFFATLYQPERSALQGNSHPLIRAFVKAAGGKPFQ